MEPSKGDQNMAVQIVFLIKKKRNRKKKWKVVVNLTDGMMENGKMVEFPDGGLMLFLMFSLHKNKRECKT